MTQCCASLGKVFCATGSRQKALAASNLGAIAQYLLLHRLGPLQPAQRHRPHSGAFAADGCSGRCWDPCGKVSRFAAAERQDLVVSGSQQQGISREAGHSSMSQGALVRAFEPFLGWAARRYQAAVADHLIKYGLRYEDLLDPINDLDIEEALKRIPQEEVDARNQRLKRASDISLKKAYLPEHLQAQQTPYLSYVQDALDQVKAEVEERELLGSGAPYQRTIP